MDNPFETIEAKLNSIENLILDIKHQSKQIESGKSEDQLLTIQEAAEFLDLKVSTLYSKVSKGELPVMKTSKRLYFSRTELINYIKEGRKKTNEEIEREADHYMSKNKNRI